MARKTKEQIQHHHRLRKLPGGRTILYRCMDCRFGVYWAQKEWLIGQKCACWTCGTKFKFTENDFNQENLIICFSCLNPGLVNNMIEATEKLEKEISARQKEYNEQIFQEMDRLRNEMVGDVDDDMLRQIAEQNIKAKTISH